jgi:hypothetical protein
MYCVSMPTSSVSSPRSSSADTAASSVPLIHAARGSARCEVISSPGISAVSGRSIPSTEKRLPKPMLLASMDASEPRSSLS